MKKVLFLAFLLSSTIFNPVQATVDPEKGPLCQATKVYTTKVTESIDLVEDCIAGEYGKYYYKGQKITYKEMVDKLWPKEYVDRMKSNIQKLEEEDRRKQDVFLKEEDTIILSFSEIEDVIRAVEAKYGTDNGIRKSTDTEVLNACAPEPKEFVFWSGHIAVGCKSQIIGVKSGWFLEFDDREKVRTKRQLFDFLWIKMESDDGGTGSWVQIGAQSLSERQELAVQKVVQTINKKWPEFRAKILDQLVSIKSKISVEKMPIYDRLVFLLSDISTAVTPNKKRNIPKSKK